MIQQSHLQVFTQKKESTLWKDNMYSITAALFLIAKHMKATKVFIGGWMDKEDVAYMHNGISLAIKKKNEVLPFVTIWMDLDVITLSKMSDKGKYHIISHICASKQTKQNVNS